MGHVAISWSRLAAVGAMLAFASATAAEPLTQLPQLVLDAEGHTAAVNKVRFLSTEQLATVSNDKTIRLWDLRSGEPLLVLRPPLGPGSAGMLYALAVAPDGRWLAAGGFEYAGNDHGIYLINLQTNAMQAVLRGHTNVILDLAFSPDGRWLASASADKTARVWDWKSGQSEQVLRGHTDSVYALAFSADSRSLATASLDKTARLWTVPAGQGQHVLRGHAGGLQSVAVNRDGSRIAVGGVDQSISIWSSAGELVQRYEGVGNHVTSLGFTPSERELFFTLGGPGETDGGFFLDLKTNRRRPGMTAHENSVLHGSLSPDGALAATADANGEAIVWQTGSGAVQHRLRSKARRPWSAAWDRESQAIAWGNTSDYRQPNERGPLEYAFSVAELECIDPRPSALLRASTEIGSVTLRPVDDTTLAVSSAGRAAVRFQLSSRIDKIRCFTLIDEQTAMVGSDFELLAFDIRSGRAIRSLHGHAGAVWAVAPSPDGRYLMSAGDDQTLRIWPSGGNQPLVSLYFADRQWIAWTPQGYYAASPGGEQLMGWHVNQGRDELGAFYPAARFRRSLYRPDIISRLLDAGNVPAALAAADREAQQATELTTVVEVLPPEVRITHPSEIPLEISQPQLLVRAVARARNNQPITAMRLLLDGRPYEGRKGIQIIPVDQQQRDGEFQREWTAELSPGRHSLAVLAETSVSKGLSDAIEVTYREPEVAEVPALPDLHVLAVGISSYPGPLKLDYAAKDAQDFTAKLQEVGAPLFRKVNLRLLTNEQATRQNILSGWTWLRREATQRDVSVFFYSGHGAKDETGNFHFVPIDGDPQDLIATAVSGSQFKDALPTIPGRVLVLLDACHAGAAGGDRRKAVGGLADDLVRDLATDDYGAIVMCSSMGSEFSMESDEHQQGYFTLALNEALAGKADYNRDGFVYLTEVDAYLADRIKVLTQGKQHPVTAKPATIRSFPLSKP
jgi:WD40 repeat protein